MDEDMLVAGMKADTWREEGPWLLLLLIPLVALGFRRGVLSVVLLLLLPIPRPAQALEWQDLWSRPDQRAARLLEEGKAEQAAQEFLQPDWKAAAQYRNGDYEASIKTLEGLDSDEAWYNKANAHAQAGRYAEAIQAYDEVLKRNAEHEDAKYNREQVMKQLSSENQQQSDQQQGEEGDSSEQSSSEQQGEQSPGESQQSENGDESAQSGDEQNTTQQEEKQQQGSNSEQQDESDEQASSAEQEQGENETEQQQQNAAELDDNMGTNEQQQVTEQWLRRIPDDPGGLLRRKFKYQYQRQGSAGSEEQSW
jgi:Ca-activated chloride channel family protein